MTTEIEKAERVVAELEDKRRHLVQQATELDAERQKISYAAFTGDQKARQRLDRINTETATHNSEMASLSAAIHEANTRVAAAHRNAAIAADKAQATELAEVLETFVECGRDIDAALAIIVEKSQLMEKTLFRMNQLGSASPNSRQLESIGSRALITALMETPWRREFQHLPPGERRSFNEMVDAWYPMVEANIAQRLGSNEEAA
jgi:hypothetical protein